MKSPTALLRAAVCTGCLLIPQVLFAQDVPEQEQPEEQEQAEPQRPTQPEPGQPPPKQPMRPPQKPGEQALQEGQGQETLTGIYDFTRKEIVMGLLGNARGESRQVKKLSAQMIRDHQKLDDRIVSMAIKQKVELQPEAEMETDEMEDLRGAEGAEFDKMFIDKIVSSHQQKLEELTSQIQDPQNKQLKPLLKQSRQVLQKHLKQAQRAQKQVETMPAG